MEFKDFWGLYLFLFGLAAFLWVVFVRFVFRITRIVRNQEAQIKLLEQIALASNVNIEIIKKIESERTHSVAEDFGVVVSEQAQSSATNFIQSSE